MSVSGNKPNVLVINCNALQCLRQNYEGNEDENNLFGASEGLENYANDQQEEQMDKVTENKVEMQKQENEAIDSRRLHLAMQKV